MNNTLHDIYNGHPTTPANYYYSFHISMHGKQPSFLSHLKDPEQYKVSVPGVQEKTLNFIIFQPS